MISRAVLATICAALLLGACQRPPKATAPKVETIVDSAAAARVAVAAGNCAAALPHLRRALASDPESLFLRFNLGVCAERLGARDETVLQFSWVVANVEPSSPEAQTAYRWLIDAGILIKEKPAEAKDDPTVGDSSLRGVVVWNEAGEVPARRGRQQLFLRGIRGTPTKELQYVRRSDDNGNYEFKNVVPGTYKLTDVIAGQPKWRLNVTIDPGKATELDLGPSNGATVRDDFPGD